MVTGGLGYIGSHTVVELIGNGYEIVIVDSLRNSEKFILHRIEEITNAKPVFYQEDVCNEAVMQDIFATHPIDLVIHFAADKSVGESVADPLKYFKNNLNSLLVVLSCMKTNRCDRLVFSSSATVYGQPECFPITEETAFQKALSAYGSTKQMGEEIMEKVCTSGLLQGIALRYFNPVGAHESALIGELPKGIPNNLFPYVMQTATGQLPTLTVYGNDYPTPDGSCLRDYIHVVDLAKAHVKACARLLHAENETSFEVFNVGTGHPTSVLETIQAFEQLTGIKLNYTVGDRRTGDAAAVYADTTKANNELGWKAEKGLDDMIVSSWNWTKRMKNTNEVQ